jgi:hypothetical protein
MGTDRLIIIIILGALLAVSGCITTPSPDRAGNLTYTSPLTTGTRLPTEAQALTVTPQSIPAGPGNSHKTPASTVQDLITSVEDAVVYSQRVGKEAAIKEFSDKNGSFTRGEQYIWAYDFEGINLAHPYHPEYKGQNKLSLTDDTGVRMIEAMMDAARNGSGFVSYQFTNPVTGTTEQKLAYVKRVDDTWWLASGIYGSDLVIPIETPEMIGELLHAKV